MRLYRCIITGDELFTDIYPFERCDGLYKVKGKYVTRSEKLDESKLGANPSAEEAGDGADDFSESGINIVLDNRLQKTGFGTKKEYMVYFKDFVKRMEEHWKTRNPGQDVDAWRVSIQATFKKVLSWFDSCEFYTGESCNPDGNIVMVRWETPEGETDDVPYLYVYEHGVAEEKC